MFFAVFNSLQGDIFHSTWTYCGLVSETSLLSVCYGMQGHTLCPALYVQHHVLFPRIVNSHSSVLLMERSRAVPSKKETAFPQDISPDLFKDTAVERAVLFHGVLSDNRKLSVYLHFPHCSVTTLLHTLPGATAVPYRQDCLFFEPLSFVGCGFCFSVSAQEGNLLTLYLQKCV